MSARDKIEQLWEYFLEADGNPEEKSMFLDVILALFLVDLKNGKHPKEIFPPSLPGGVTSQISEEFITAVHLICSGAWNDEENVFRLRKFLMCGYGWRLLAVLNALGGAKISSKHSLASLLLTIYPLCAQDDYGVRPPPQPNPYVASRATFEVDPFSHRKTPVKRFSSGAVCPPASVDLARSHSYMASLRRRQRGEGDGLPLSSDSEGLADDEKLATVAGSLKIRLNPMDFDYFTSVVRSEDERIQSRNYVPRSRQAREKKKKRAKDFVDDVVKHVFQQEVSSFSFFQLVLSVLKDICDDDSTFMTNRTNPLCVQAIGFVLEHFDNQPKYLGPLEVAELKCSLAHLLCISLERAEPSEAAATIIIQRGMIAILVRILEEAIRRWRPGTADSLDDDKSILLATRTHDYIFGLVYGILNFIYNLLFLRCSMDKISDFLELFHSFSCSGNSRLVDRTVIFLLTMPTVSQQLRVSRAIRLIDLIGQLIVAMKKVRAVLVHSHQCKSKRHKQCGGADLAMHHHQDLFGCVYSPLLISGGTNTTRSCCVSALFMTLVRLIQLPYKEPVLVTLRAMTACGTCCCFPVWVVIQALVTSFKESSPRIRAAGLALLERTIYFELGAFAKPLAVHSCIICDQVGFKSSQRHPASLSGERASTLPVEDMHSSVTHSAAGDMSADSQQDYWSCLRLYADLLQSPDAKLRHAITCHLSTIAPRCNNHVKIIIFFDLLYPTFVQAKARLAEDKLADFTVVSCLSIFTSLLSSSLFARLFVKADGLKHIRDLIVMHNFSKLCCSILEITAIIEIWQVECENKLVGVDPCEIAGQLWSLPSLSMLHDSLEVSTGLLLDRFDRHQRTRRDESGRIYARSVSAVSNELFVDCETNVQNQDSGKTELDWNGFKNLSTRQILQLEGCETVEESYLLLLLNCCVFWRSCAMLAVSSPQYRLQLSKSPTSKESFLLLKNVTTFLAEGYTIIDGDTCQRLEHHLYVKLMEALLIVNLAALPVIEGVPMSCAQVISTVHQLLMEVNPAVDLQPVCDALVRCAIIHTSSNQVLPPSPKPKIPPLSVGATAEPNLSDEDGDATAAASFADMSEETYITADEGYEADVEVPGVADAEEEEKGPPLQGDDGGIVSPPALRMARGNNIVHPGLCLLAIELLVTMHNGYTYTQEVNPTKQAETHLASVAHCLQRLLILCRENTANCVTLAKCGISAILLRGFQDVLTTRHERFTELQRIILEFQTLMARHTLTPQDLALYLNLFKVDDPPLDALLAPLVSLASTSLPQPHFILCFPVERDLVLPSAEAVRESWEALPSSDAATNLVKRLNKAHLDAGIKSCWSACALSLPIVTDLGWPMWLHGFSVALWLRVDHTARVTDANLPGAPRKTSATEPGISDASASDWKQMSESWRRLSGQDSVNNLPLPVILVHLFSIGMENLVLETWHDSSTNKLLLCLCRTDLTTHEVLAEEEVNDVLVVGQWHYLAVNVSHYSAERRNIVKVELIVDGWRKHNAFLRLPGLVPRKAAPACLLLGHAAPSATHPWALWYFGSLMVFRSPCITPETAVCMVGLGPNFTCLADTVSDHQVPNFTSVFSAETLSCGMNWEYILDGNHSVISVLQEQLLLTYAAHSATLVNFYPQVLALPNQTTLFSQLPGSGSTGYRIQASDTRASQQIPLTLMPTVMAATNCQQYQGLVSAASILGGPTVFLYLFARVVELEATQETQAKALHLLLRLVQADSELYSKFVTQEGPKLLLQVFASKRCRAGLHMLKAILDNCFDKPVVQYHSGTQRFHVVKQCEPLVVNTSLLRTLLHSHAVWTWEGEGEGESAAALMVEALHVLLKDDHCHREFNVAQLRRMHTVEAVLLFCKECFLNEQWSHLSKPLCAQLVLLVCSLMGAPPEFSHLGLILDTLLLLHPASTTYVSHARASFYYLLAPTPPNQVPRGHRSSEWAHTPHREADTNAQNDALNELKSTISPLQPIDINILNSLPLQRQEECDKNEEKEVEEVEKKQPQTPTTETVGPNPGNTAFHYGVTVGLLELLRDTIYILPDNMASQVLNHVVTPEILLVFVNHFNYDVRVAVIEVLSAYLERSSAVEIQRLVRMRAFHQLANQLSLYRATPRLVDVCLTLVARHTVVLDEPRDLSKMRITDLVLKGCPVLLGLLSATIHDPALMHGLMIYLQEIFTLFPKTNRVFLDAGLVEVLLKTLVAVSHLEGDLPHDKQVDDIRTFLAKIATTALNAKGGYQTQVINEMQLQLNYLEGRERDACGDKAVCVKIVRDTHTVVLEGALDLVQCKIHTLEQPDAKLKVTPVLLASVNGGEISVPSAEFRAPTPQPEKELSKSELSERFHVIVLKSVELLTNSDLSVEPSVTEQTFACRLLGVLLNAVSSALERRSQRSPWSMVMWAAKSMLRVQAAALITWMLAPDNVLTLRLFAMNSLRRETKLKDWLVDLLHSSPHTEQRFTAFLCELLNNTEYGLQVVDRRAILDLIMLMQSLDITVPVANSEMWRDATEVICADMDKHRRLHHKQKEAAVARSVQKHEELALAVAESAMAATRAVVELQNVQRKALMEHVKAAYSDALHARLKWQDIVQRATHERAVWFFERSYPRSWMLDSTEGPCRVRIRLKRCNLAVNRRYIMESRRCYNTGPQQPAPLQYLLEHDRLPSPSSTLMIERLHTNEKVRHMCAARIVTPACEVHGELLIGVCSLYFVADEQEDNITLGMLDLTSTAWQFDAIKEIHKRRFQLKECALEVFLLNGKTYLVAFKTPKLRDTFLAMLKQCTLLYRIDMDSDQLEDAKQLWREGVLTNWEYLTQLNKMAGRSYNDLMQYPVFPFVLADYTSKILDLTDPLVYRNFNKPMAVQDKRNEQHYINNYNYLKQELLDGTQHILLNQEPYHYGSHYSNSGTVLHFLVRMPPFTQMFLTYQDENFDLPDRTFHSLHTTWRLASSDSTTDVKEMIPEFFYLPEFLQNNEGFEFGVRQNGERVNDVDLPPWCSGNARLFVLVHRQALEASHVREHLPHWLDLVYGCKQTGKAAVDAINVFHPATYSGFNVETIGDPLERSAWETMIRTYGQTPRQLLRVPHPMVVQTLASHMAKTAVRDVVPGVKGLSWGTYVGSPTDPDPVVVWKHNCRPPVATLVSLVTNDVYGIAPRSCLLVAYTREKGLGYYSTTTSVQSVAQATWHADSVIRIKTKKEQIPWPVARVSALDPVCICATTPDGNQLWLGHISGKILVYKFFFEPVKNSIQFESEATALYGHGSSVTSLSLCRGFSVAASGSGDCTAIIWDLNTLTYVRTVTLPDPVDLVCVSATLGDVAISCQNTLHYFTINGARVDTVTGSKKITALCFSNAPEGISVNVIACGMSNGHIMLWSTWDLSPVRELSLPFLHEPIVSVTYSYDSQHLYAAAQDGAVVIWERAGPKVACKAPKFVNLTGL